MHITPACGHAGIPGQPGLHDRFQSSWLHSETHPATFQKEKKTTKKHKKREHFRLYTGHLNYNFI